MKIYVITGATSGIGNALVKEFARDNIVYAGYRNEAFVNDLKEISPNVIPFYIDMSKPDTIAHASDFIKFQAERIDTLINAAGCVVAGAMECIDINRIREQFEVNTFGHLDFSQRVLPLIKCGKIINISSMASYGIFPFVAPYCASKRALDILFNALELENGVKVISIKPGVIATPLWDKSVECNKNETSETYKKEFDYLLENAHKNGTDGLNVKKVVDVIVKADKSNHPKASYTIGKDAFGAMLLSKLPQNWINFAVKTGMKLRIKN